MLVLCFEISFYRAAFFNAFCLLLLYEVNRIYNLVLKIIHTLLDGVSS